MKKGKKVPSLDGRRNVNWRPGLFYSTYEWLTGKLMNPALRQAAGRQALVKLLRLGRGVVSL